MPTTGTPFSTAGSKGHRGRLWGAGCVLHLWGVWGVGRERGGHGALMNLRFVFLPGDRAGTDFLPRTPFLIYLQTAGSDFAGPSSGLASRRRKLHDCGASPHQAQLGPSPGLVSWGLPSGLHPTQSRSCALASVHGGPGLFSDMTPPAQWVMQPWEEHHGAPPASVPSPVTRRGTAVLAHRVDVRTR